MHQQYTRTHECTRCGGTFSGHPNRRYCDACQVLHQQDVSRGKHSRRRFGGLYDAVLDRDEHACQHCGKTARLCIHHRDGDNTHNTMDNLLTLCRGCHYLEHVRMNPAHWVALGKRSLGRRHSPEAREKMSRAVRAHPGFHPKRPTLSKSEANRQRWAALTPEQRAALCRRISEGKQRSRATRTH